MPQRNDKLQEKMAAQRERVLAGDGEYVLDPPTYNRRARRKAAWDYARPILKREKKLKRRHSREGRYELMRGHFRDKTLRDDRVDEGATLEP